MVLLLAASACEHDATAPVYTARPIALSVTSQHLVVEDLDDDGRVDLVSVGGSGAAVHPLIAGRFMEATVLAHPGRCIRA